MAVLIGLLVAASFGSADFLGGLASRRVATLTALAIAQMPALLGAVAVVAIAGGEIVGHDLALGAVAGVLNVTALGCLFRGFAIGRIGQVAPVAAVIGAVIPVGWGLATGERPSNLALAGVALAIVAGGLISRERDEPGAETDPRALLFALGAGLGFGSSFVCFAAASHGSGFWPVLSGRIAATVAVALVVAVVRPAFTFDHAHRAPHVQAACSGAFDVGATALLLVAVRHGLAATVAPVASLAPGFTVTHAWWYLHERATAIQLVGLGLALMGLVCIAAG